MRGGSFKRRHHDVREAIVIQIAERGAALVSAPQEVLAHLADTSSNCLPSEIAKHGVVLASGSD